MDDLLDRLATDLDGAFDALLVAHQDRLHSIALRLTGDRSDAEEVAQDAFVRAYRALATYEPERIRTLEVRAWLATIVVNLCRNRARRRRPATVSIDGPAVNGRDDTGVAARTGGLDLRDDAMREPDAMAQRRAGAEEWARLLLELPPRYREAVVLRHVDGLGYEEMASALGQPVGTLKARVHRGLALLRAAHDAGRRTVEATSTDTGVEVTGRATAGQPRHDHLEPIHVRAVRPQLPTEAVR